VNPFVAVRLLDRELCASVLLFSVIHGQLIIEPCLLINARPWAIPLQSTEQITSVFSTEWVSSDATPNIGQQRRQWMIQTRSGSKLKILQETLWMRVILFNVSLPTLIERTSSACNEHAAPHEHDASRNHLTTSWSGVCGITKNIMKSRRYLRKHVVCRHIAHSEWIHSSLHCNSATT
jgi:hypothetical protein